jgi:hypothetical protein
MAGLLDEMRRAREAGERERKYLADISERARQEELAERKLAREAQAAAAVADREARREEERKRQELELAREQRAAATAKQYADSTIQAFSELRNSTEMRVSGMVNSRVIF